MRTSYVRATKSPQPVVRIQNRTTGYGLFWKLA
jgi:hypothetical protein